MITLSSDQHGLGDTLVLTSLAKNITEPVKVLLPKKVERFSILFDKLANVEIVDDDKFRGYGSTPNFGCGPYIRQKLRGFFRNEAEYMDIRPLVLHTKPSSELWAAEYLADKLNPVIFVPTCSPQWASVRNLPVKLAHSVHAELKEKGFTPIVCQSSSNFLDIGEHQLYDLDLSKYICLLRQAGQYVGANTGDEHLATAVGCGTVVYQPEDHSLFNSVEWNYNHPYSTYYTWPIS